MSKIVFFCIPAHGHTNPTIEVVRELVDRGNEVVYYSFNEFKDKINIDLLNYDYDKIYSYNGELINSIIKSKNYEELLKVFNHKAIIGESQIISICECKNKESYINFILRVLNEDSDDSKQLKSAFRKYIEFEK